MRLRAPRGRSAVGTTGLLLLSPLLLVASVPATAPGASAGGLQVSLQTTGDVGGPVLAPGLTLPLDLRVANPYGLVVEVTHLRVRVGAVRPGPVAGCGAADFVASDALLPPLVVPARGSTTLSAAGVPVAQWPRLSMPADTSDRDGCRGLVLALDFTATGQFR